MKKWFKKHRKTALVLKIFSVILLLAVSGIFVGDRLFSAALYPKGDKRMEKIVKSPHYKNSKFHNAKNWKSPTFWKGLSIAWKFMFTGNQRSPKKKLPVRQVNMEHFKSEDRNRLNATWLGHSSLLINIGGYKILTDPVFEKRVTIVGPSRFNGKLPMRLDQLPAEIDAVIISHNHYDHLNKYSVRFLNHKTRVFIVPLMVGAQLEKWGIPRRKIVEMDWWEEYRVNKDLLIAATPSQHFSNRGLSDRNKTLWASFVIKGPNHNVFFSGDSGYFNGFKKIGEKYGPFDMTFLECGAYNERWHAVHMYPEETVQAHLDLNGKILHPIHWGTFNLSLHPWYEPMQRLTAAAAAKNVETSTPVVGDTTVYGKYIPSQKWWEPLVKPKRAKPKPVKPKPVKPNPALQNRKPVLERVPNKTN